MALMESVSSIMRVGLGPSSSYTTSPMMSALHFVRELKEKNLINNIGHIRVKLHGSLSTIGRVRMTDKAVLLGLTGSTPETIDLEEMPFIVDSIKKSGHLKLNGHHDIELQPQRDICYINDKYEGKSGVIFEAYDSSKTQKKIHSHFYYSLHGGVVSDGKGYDFPPVLTGDAPHPYSNAEELLNECKKNHSTISTIVIENEASIQKKSIDEIIKDTDQKIWGIMKESITRGLQSEGLLPGELKLARRAPPLFRLLKSSKSIQSDPMLITDWTGLYALAVSEENAAGGRVISMPTSGACGVVPAILEYFNHFVHETTADERVRYLLTCGAIGLLYKKNASISGAVVGCQGEIGVASSMAAAGLTELLTSNPWRVLSAAEHAMEHSLGMTCDPAKLYVQVPCIERNAIGALKALTASRMANLRSYPIKISLDAVIKTMYETGRDLKDKYRKTGCGPIGANTR